MQDTCPQIQNGDNIVINSYIPLENSRNKVQHMWDMQIS